MTQQCVLLLCARLSPSGPLSMQKRERESTRTRTRTRTHWQPGDSWLATRRPQACTPTPVPTSRRRAFAVSHLPHHHDETQSTYRQSVTCSRVGPGNRGVGARTYHACTVEECVCVYSLQYV